MALALLAGLAFVWVVGRHVEVEVEDDDRSDVGDYGIIEEDAYRIGRVGAYIH
jgi:hypothetical protein